MSEPGSPDESEVAKYIADKPAATEISAAREELILDLTANLLAKLNRDRGVGSAAFKDMLRHKEEQLGQYKGAGAAGEIGDFYRLNETAYVPNDVIIIDDASFSDMGRTPVRGANPDVTRELMYVDSDVTSNLTRGVQTDLLFDSRLAGAIKTEPAVPPDVYVGPIHRKERRFQTKNVINIIGGRNVILGGEISGPKFAVNVKASESCAVMPGCVIDNEHGDRLIVRKPDGERGKVINYGGRADFKTIDAERVDGGHITPPPFATGSGQGVS